MNLEQYRVTYWEKRWLYHYFCTAHCSVMMTIATIEFLERSQNFPNQPCDINFSFALSVYLFSIMLVSFMIALYCSTLLYNIAVTWRQLIVCKYYTENLDSWVCKRSVTNRDINSILCSHYISYLYYSMTYFMKILTSCWYIFELLGDGILVCAKYAYFCRCYVLCIILVGYSYFLPICFGMTKRKSCQRSL